MIVAALLFAALAGVAYILWLGTEWLERQGVPAYLHVGVLGIAIFLFGLDVLCFVVFALGETIKLLLEIYEDIRRPR